MLIRLRKRLIAWLSSILNWLKKSDSLTKASRWRLWFWQRELPMSPIWISVVSITLFFLVLTLELAVGESGIILPKLFAIAVLTAMFFIFIVFYIKRDAPEFINDVDILTLTSLLVIISMILIEATRFLKLSPYIVPTSTTAMLIALLISSRMALISSFLLALLLAIVNGFEFNYFFFSFFSNLFGIIGVINVRHRLDLITTGLKLCGFNVIIITILALAQGWQLNLFLSIAILGLLNGLFASILTLGILPYLEITFSRTTNIRLLELADFNHQLLKQLSLEAPGTFHHSLLVAALAEQSAEIIHANSLLCRVIAYYHDIGKLTKPEFFIENQILPVSKHDNLKASVSSLVIIAHVKEGAILAQKYNLDHEIIYIIQQHHGTSLIRFFYTKLLEINKHENVSEELFRYPGPKPKSKEAAIVMLSDMVEAATRSLNDPTPTRVKDLIYKIINNQFIDSQFDQCPITLADLHHIGEKFIKTLVGIYHPRIEYPVKQSENIVK